MVKSWKMEKWSDGIEDGEVSDDSELRDDY